jgi:long-subunit acyl-CoA synthetase (AMP-forming)
MVKPGSIGVTIPNTEVNIVDPATESTLGTDKNGEVWFAVRM